MEQFEYVKAIKFGVMSKEAIRRGSVCQVVTDDINHKKENEHHGYVGGLFDLRMGSIHPHQKCHTCNRSNSECTGHFGHIELEKRILNPMFVPYIRNLLQCVCWNCSLVKLHPKSQTWKNIMRISDPETRFYALLKHCQDVKCCRYNEGNDLRGCGFVQPSFHIDTRNKVFILAHWENQQKGPKKEQKEKVRISPDEIYVVFRRIEPAHIYILGMDPDISRPESLVMENLPVVSPLIRPPNVYASGEDMLTTKYIDISRANTKIQKSSDRDSKVKELEDMWRLLQFHVTGLMCCKKLSAQYLRKLMKRLQDITSHLIKKKGRIRENLLGKRTDFTHRTVITPDPNLNINQVGVSDESAKILYYQEVVTPRNIEDLRQRIIRGSHIINGANFISKHYKAKEIFDLSNATESERRMYAENLKIGMCVARHLKDGDPVIICRQPSLHRYNLMCFRAKINCGSSTMRLNLTSPSPYNADFDGDEMNMHILTNQQSCAEGLELMAFEKNCLIPQSSGPVYGLIQDDLLAAYMMTMKDSFLTREQAMRLLSVLMDRDSDFPIQNPYYDKFSFRLPIPALLVPVPLWTGKQIFSMLLPPDFCEWKPTLMHNQSKPTGDPMCDTVLIIQQGEILAGHLDVKSMGISVNSILHKIANDYENGIFSRFLNRAHHICAYYISHIHPVSMGLSDVQAPDGFQEKLDKAIEEIDRKIHEWVQQGMDEEKLERMVWTCITNLTKEAHSDTISCMPLSNNFRKLLNGGTKGSPSNASQIIRVVGQQNIKGGRLNRKMFGFEERNLPWSKPGDKSLEEGGYIPRPYIEGISLQNYIVGCITGRIGMIDTSIRTALAGYAFRRLCGGMSDIMVKQDLTVRNAQNKIIQFAFGDDGFDASFCEYQMIFFLVIEKKHGSVDLERLYKWESTQSKLLQDEFKRLQKDYSIVKNLDPVPDQLWVPVHFERTLERALARQNDPQHPNFDSRHLVVDPETVIVDVLALQKEVFAFMPKAAEKWNNSFFILLRSYLASKHICNDLKISTPLWKETMDWIRKKFISSLIQAGESVGTIAAQSCSQKFTQLTLSNFHSQGSSKSNDTNHGIGRFTQVINASQKIKNPSMTLELLPNYAKQESVVSECMRSLKQVTVADLVESQVIEDCNEPLPVLLLYRASESLNTCLAPFLVKMTLKKALFSQHNITTAQVAKRLGGLYRRVLNIWYTPEWDKQQPATLFLRIVSRTPDFISKLLLEDFCKAICEKTIIQGIPNVTDVYSQREGKQFKIHTEGIDIPAVVQKRFVKASAIYTNHTRLIHKIYGVEAYRNSLVHEISSILSMVGSPINNRQLTLMADSMTYLGNIIPMTRHGINRIPGTGVLERAAFEELTDQITAGALFPKIDVLKGMSEQMMLGRPPDTGTNMCEVNLDFQKLEQSIVPEQYVPLSSAKTTVINLSETTTKMEVDNAKKQQHLLQLMQDLQEDHLMTISTNPVKGPNVTTTQDSVMIDL